MCTALPAGTWLACPTVRSPSWQPRTQRAKDAEAFRGHAGHGPNTLPLGVGANDPGTVYSVEGIPQERRPSLPGILTIGASQFTHLRSKADLDSKHTKTGITPGLCVGAAWNSRRRYHDQRERTRVPREPHGGTPVRGWVSSPKLPWPRPRSTSI